jgi:ubiquinone/menaquinone biosynthesis C-methylase UbiE
MATNYFSSPAVAERYAYARPDLNRLFNEELLRHTGPLEVVADFGCGTGLSSRALTEVAGVVIGLDPSLAMLEHASPHPQVLYCAGVAEAAPFAAGSFELVAAGLALHWFDRDRFLAEALRVLTPGGWLFTYNTWFTGTMRNNVDFGTWNREQYLARYPIPPRFDNPIVGPDSPAAGFSLRATWNIEVDVSMSGEQLSHYLTTQSNVSAVLEREGETIEDATEWLQKAVAPFFASQEEEFPFGGSAWLLQRA